MNYEWDEKKMASNIVCRGIDFILIKKFDWATCLSVLDIRFKEPKYAV